MKIIRNSTKCLICGEEVESRHRHDFQQCRCGNVTVDGGTDYFRTIIRHLDKAEDTSIVEKDEKNEGTPPVHFKGDGFTKRSA